MPVKTEDLEAFRASGYASLGHPEKPDAKKPSLGDQQRAVKESTTTQKKHIDGGSEEGIDLSSEGPGESEMREHGSVVSRSRLVQEGRDGYYSLDGALSRPRGAAALGEAADGNYNEQSAIEWAAGFSFPANICERDSNLLDLADGDLVVMAKSSHEARENEDRLSTARAHATVPQDDPDFERLLVLCDGVKILVPKDFTPNTTPPLLRNKYKRVCTAVNKMFFEGYLEGLVYLLPTHRLLSMSGIHWSSAHWTTKAGKQKGRNIGDLSNDERGGALNSPEAKLLGQEAWGDIKHPTVDMLVGMIIRQYKRSANGWADVVLWKMDLKGAFTLMFIHPESVPLLAMQLTGGVSMVYHTGLFGSTLMPGAFD
eukprot:gene1097-1236_t